MAPLFFGTADLLQEVHKQVESSQKHSNGAVWILRMEDVHFIDASGMEALFQFQENCKSSGVHLLLSGLSTRVLKSIQNADIGHHFGSHRLFPDLDGAIQESRLLV